MEDGEELGQPLPLLFTRPIFVFPESWLDASQDDGGDSETAPGLLWVSNRRFDVECGGGDKAEPEF